MSDDKEAARQQLVQAMHEAAQARAREMQARAALRAVNKKAAESKKGK
jgi:hypothetical protein